jgi:flagellar biosynthesis/type III secretory pathway chaperone
MAVAVTQSGMAGQLLEEYEGYCALETLLAREQEALVDVASERVAAIAGEKERVTRKLQELGVRRVSLLQAQGVSGDAAGMRKWLTRHPDLARQIGPTWDMLSDKAETTRRQNQTNGRLIDALVQHLQARLNMISSATCANPTYGPTGMAEMVRFPTGFRRA